MVVVVVLLVGVAGVVLWKGLAEATLYFYNVDEAVEQRTDLVDDRFRIQGTVMPDTIVEVGTVLEFDITFNGVVASVEHTGGSPPALFREGMPVVLEGRWAGDVFVSDAEIIVKHDETYEEVNPDRIADAEQGGSSDAEQDDTGGGSGGGPGAP